MQHYSHLTSRAHNGQTPVGLDEQYLKSAAFSNRVTRMSEKDFVNVALFMLKHVALQPSAAEANIQHLCETGVAVFDFYRVCMPGPVLMYISNPAHVFELLKAMRNNTSSKLFKAALASEALYHSQGRYRRLMTPSKSKMLAAEHKRFRESLNWKTPEDYKAERATHPEGFAPLCRSYDSDLSQLASKAHQARVQLRLDRIHRISRAASSPQYLDWHSIIEGLAREVLTPETDATYKQAQPA